MADSNSSSSSTVAEIKPKLLELWKTKLDKALHEKNIFTEQLEKIEQKFGVPRVYVAYGLIVFVAVFLLVGYGAQFLCNFIGFLYPAYASVKAIESKEKDDDTKWLTYWVVYSAFSLIEFFADIFLFWIPFYWFFKCIFIVYCMAPTKWNGSITIYTKLIRPFVLKHQQAIDKALDDATKAAVGLASEAESMANDVAGEAAKKYIQDSAKTD